MKNKSYTITLPINFNDDDIKKSLGKSGTKNIKNYNIIRKSLDARKKNNIRWNIEVEINTEPQDFRKIKENSFNLKYKKRDENIVIVGSGPAGIFSGILLLEAGFKVTLIERGFDVDTRSSDIDNLQNNSIFKENSNFAFGEGGAGTFSDGKLTSRSKHISTEKDYILSTFILNGAPKEIFSMVHPHLGSDNLKKIVKNMRNQFKELGGEILFNTDFKSFINLNGNIKSIKTSNGVIDCNYLILATGHSSFSTYRELINSGVNFRNKNFAIGFRAEHSQFDINKAQWGVAEIKGLKAAEYRLTAKVENSSVFSFCMCPGGTIVPAGALPGTSVVNGMSNYKRSGEFANAAVVATFDFERELKREVSPLETLDLLQKLEESYFNATSGYSVPAMKISDFINSTNKGVLGKSSYIPGLTDYNLEELLPKSVIAPLKNGLVNFSRKIKGYDNGKIMGLESKTSSPIQVLRDREGLCEGFRNLYFSGEGSGWAGGIVSSAADGLKAAISIINKN